MQVTMKDVIDFFLCYWFIIAIIVSLFWGIRGLHMSLLKDWKDHLSKSGYFFWLSYQLIFNFIGSFAGWFCFYILLIRTQKKLPELTATFDTSDFLLFLLSILGLTGHLPQTLYGLVVSVGKFAEAGTSRLLGEKTTADTKK
jgi:hypothetical protein